MEASNQNDYEISSSEKKNEMYQPTETDVNVLAEDKVAEEKMTKWEKEPTLTELLQDLEFARQETNEQSANVDGWLNLRNTTGSEAPKKTKPGRSNIQPKLIRKHNEWRYPALSEPFLNTDRMYTVKPRTHEDVTRAKQNQILLNWQFDTKINKVDFIDRYVRTAVDEGSVVVRVGWEREFGKREVEKTKYNYFPVQDEAKAQVIMQAVQFLEAEAPDYESLPDSLKASAEQSKEMGFPVEAVADGVVKVVEDIVVKNCPSVRIVNIKNLFVDPACDGEWEKAQFMVYTYEATESELRSKKSFRNLNKVNWSHNQIQSQHGNQDHESNTPATDTRTNSRKRKVLVYEYWGLFDAHNNGIMIPIVVTWIGDTIIQMAENPFPDGRPPFVMVPYMPILGSVFGEADASLLQDNQRIIGAVTRGMIDLMGRSANAQSGYAKGFLDPVNKRRFNAGEDFEFNPNGDPRAAIQQMTYPEIPRSAHEMIASQNTEAESLTGVKAFSGGISGDAYGSVATGIRGALDSASTREMSILRRLAYGMQVIGQKFMAMNARYLSEKEIVRVTNEEFVEISRQELAGNFDLKVDIATASVDEQKAQDLGFMMQTVGPDMEPGLRGEFLAEIADLKRMPEFAERIRNYEPPVDPVQQKLQELEVAKIEAEIEVERAKAAEFRAKAAQISLGIDNDVSGLTHERDIEKQGAQARGNRDLEVTKAILNGETGAGNIQAGVGYNALTEAKDQRDTAPKLGSGFSDPSAIPPQLAGQELPIGPLGTR